MGSRPGVLPPIKVALSMCEVTRLVGAFSNKKLTVADSKWTLNFLLVSSQGCGALAHTESLVSEFFRCRRSHPA